MKINKVGFELLLAEKELSLAKLSERSGVSRQQISTIKQRGTCNPATAAKIAKGFGVPVTDLIETDE